MEALLGHDFSRVRIHADEPAERAAGRLGADAYTVGEDIVFERGRYAPQDVEGRRLLAHELGHVVQQKVRKPEPRISRRDEPAERAASAIANRLSLGAVDMDGELESLHAAAPSAVQLQYGGGATATGSSTMANIPIADFIRYVEGVERSFPMASPAEILAAIREVYYGDFKFQQLVPDSPVYRPAPAYQQSPAGAGAAIYTGYRLSDIGSSPAERDAFQHLTARADENAQGDNPSPYIVLADGSRVDVGHLFLALDSLIHPRVGSPYADYGIAGIDPAGFAADLALASFWTTYHERAGKPASDAPIRPSFADFNAYYRASAPDEDLLGDIDAFAANTQRDTAPGQRLSGILRATYLGSGGAAARVNQRYRLFAAQNGLTYTVAGGSITWSTATIEAMWAPRIDRLCDLFDSGFWSRVGSMTIGSARGRGTWPHSLPALRRFLAWLKPRLEAEIAAHP